MKKHLGASLSALLLVGAIAAPAAAGHDRNPSPRVTTYSYDLAEVADNAPDDVEGTVRLKGLPNGKVIVTIEASGLTPDAPHAQHVHVPGGEDGSAFVRGACPTIADDADGDGLVDTLEGAPSYGGVKQSLTTTGDTSPASALAVDRFPVADAAGELSYERTFTPTDERVHEQLGDVEVVVHGIDLDGSGAYDGDAESSLTAGNPDLFLPLEATIPVLCGGVNG